MAQQRITDLPQITQITDATKLYFGEQIKDYHGTFAQIKTALSYQHILDRLQLLEDNLIGTIQTFAALELTEDYLLCNGGEYLKSDYPKLYGKIGDVFGTGDYPAPSDSDHFRVPDLQDQFIRNTDGVKAVGKQYTDTMRKITGTFGNMTGQGPEVIADIKGAFIGYKIGQSAYINGISANGPDSIKMDSSLGIEGQVGQVSPNVGSETAPQHTILVFAIKAK